MAEEVLRFHILANSDSEEDQNVKYQVRDAVLEWMSNELHDKPEAANTQGLQTKLSSVSQQDMTALPEQAILTDHEAILQFLSENLPQIEAVANTILNEQGMSYQAIAEITWSYFPDRTYGEYTFPAGWYQTLRIRLGTAKGQNWWCLLYPALCFSDCLHASFTEDGQTQLQETLTAEEYQTLLQNPSQWKITFRWADFLF
ncbi:MAG: stage II sporulation protein R [Lachnospiraceae bacterium]|nr:stage II sporulation protein R [Lachnospiraceae bacterium]